MSGAAADAVVQPSPRIRRSASCALPDAVSRGTNRGVVQTRGASASRAGRPWSGWMRVISMRGMNRAIGVLAQSRKTTPAFGRVH